MITTALFLVLIVGRTIASTAAGGEDRGRLPVVDRIVGPVAVAFTLLVLVRLVDLWVQNA